MNAQIRHLPQPRSHLRICRIRIHHDAQALQRPYQVTELRRRRYYLHSRKAGYIACIAGRKCIYARQTTIGERPRSRITGAHLLAHALVDFALRTEGMKQGKQEIRALQLLF